MPVFPLEVLIQHPAPKSVAAHKDWFGCPVRFDVDLDAVLYSTETLAQPNHLGDEGISRRLISHLNTELSSMTAEVTLVDQAKDAMAPGTLRRVVKNDPDRDRPRPERPRFSQGFPSKARLPALSNGG